jgi:hypothetical protein
MAGGEAIVCFESVSGALLAEQALLARGLFPRPMPKPSAVSGGCGFCLRVPLADAARALAIAQEGGIAGAEAYERMECGGAASYRKIAAGGEGERN